MLLFSTVLPINDQMTKEDFIRLAIRWNQRSHPENIIPGIVWNGERNVRYGDEKLWMQIEEYRNQNIIAIRYEKAEDNGVVWNTDFVMNFNEMHMSVRLDRSYLEEAQIIYKDFRPPAFLDLLIDEGYVEDDNGLCIGRRPILIADDNLSLIADVINGGIHYGLPVVYISKTYDERDPVNAKEVAKRLKGIAHVMVQEHSWTGPALRRLCEDNNEYDGAIGIYFPNPVVGHERMLNHIYPGSGKKLADKVIRRVVQYSNSQRIDTLYTFQGVINALLLDRYSSKRSELAASMYAIKQAKHEADMRVQSADAEAEVMRRKADENQKLADEYAALVDSVDEEMENMRQQIESLTSQNEALTYEVQGLRAKLDEKSSVPILYLGTEDEFFQDEIKEFILESLTDTLAKTKAKTRRADVLDDLIRSNGGFKGTADKKKEALKKSLKGYKSLSATQKRLLEELGFKITKEGDHYKLTYYGDGRYWTTLAATPSDIRTGDNCAHHIIRDML